MFKFGSRMSRKARSLYTCTKQCFILLNVLTYQNLLVFRFDLSGRSKRPTCAVLPHSTWNRERTVRQNEKKPFHSQMLRKSKNNSFIGNQWKKVMLATLCYNGCLFLSSWVTPTFEMLVCLTINYITKIDRFTI